MNETLINPFNTLTHPTAVQTSFYAIASFARFDPSGRYIGAGKYDGSVSIWDLETRAQIRTLDGHVKAVTNLDWSRNSRFLLSSSKDWNVIIWDLAADWDPPQRYKTIRFDSPVLSASFHPRNSKIIVALMDTGDVYLVDLRKEHRSRVELVEVQEEGEEDSRHSDMTVARFDPSGRYIFVGTSAGTILVFNTRTKAMIARHKISGAGVIKGLEFSQTGRRLVTNSSDRTLRQFNVPTYPTSKDGGACLEQELEPTHRFNDPINKTAWHSMAFSPNGEWLAGGAADTATHKIYIWDISNDGQFASALDGGREPLTHLHWHPFKSCMASTTRHGNILIWHSPSPERWGAFAGGFEEVDENVEYEEKENEFDIEDEAEIQRRKMKAEEEEVDLDTVPDDPAQFSARQSVPGDDEDLTWADQEPDDDSPWKMKIIMENDDT
ncbi:WD40 repeat-like protein [Armillaria borealis]|uniref:WD40 repeat-like protein n=1 Tax=Armillaria borealis TaxID=47425 RepID=A0AA39N0Y6_9AGAR|nr:WD40 repeat-like protein [Armillaria borealis]